MKRIVSLVLAAVMMLSLVGSVAAAEEKPTLRLLTLLHSEQTAAIEDIWFFKHLENKFNIKLELEATTNEAQAERQSQLLLADDLPDLVWLGLSNSDAMTYGAGEGMLLDWNQYLNEETMPNAWKAKQEYPEAFVASTTPDGGLYSMPYIRGPVYANNTGAFSGSIRMNINKEWLEAVGMEKPATLDEFIAVARAFKEKDPGNVGEQLVPIIDNQNKVKDYIWNALGFYGCGTQAYGTQFSIKDGKIVLPAYTPEAKEFMTTMKTLYDEGLISPDYFTLDQTTNRGLVSAGVCGIFGDSTLQPAENNWKAWDSMSPLSSSVNETRVASINAVYSLGTYASAKTKYPEIVAAIVDYMYTDEAAMFYQSGPMKGTPEEQDGNGWYITEDGVVTNDLIQSNPTYTLTNGNTANYYINGLFDNYEAYRYEYAGVEHEQMYRPIVDVITGEEVQVPVADPSIWEDDNWDRHWRVSQTAAMEHYLTFVKLPNVYLTREQEDIIIDLRTVIENYITQETPKFITGARSLDEFDAYQQELKGLGIEEYIAIYAEAYAPYVASIFGE